MELRFKDHCFCREFYSKNVAIDYETNSLYIYSYFVENGYEEIYKLPLMFWQLSQLNLTDFIRMVYCNMEHFKLGEYSCPELLKELIELTEKGEING